MKLQILALHEQNDSKTQIISQAFANIFEDFSFDISDLADIPLSKVSNEIPMINCHLSIIKHPVLSRIPNLKIKSASFDVSTNIQTFTMELKNTSKVFQSKSTNKETSILSDGIIFEVGNRKFFTNLKGKSYLLKPFAQIIVSPGSFVINTSSSPIPLTTPLAVDFGFKLMTYLQRVHHPWSLVPIQSSIKRSYLIPKLSVLLTKPVEEAMSFLFSLNENMSLSDFMNALDRTSYYSDYYAVRQALRSKVQFLSFPTSYEVLLADFDEERLKLAEAILQLEIDSFRDLNPNLLI
jgi:hypothetical protein